MARLGSTRRVGAHAVALFGSGLVALACCSWVPALLPVGFGLLVTGLLVGGIWVFSMIRTEDMEASSRQAELDGVAEQAE
jgi:hypothetical protein